MPASEFSVLSDLFLILTLMKYIISPRLQFPSEWSQRWLTGSKLEILTCCRQSISKQEQAPVQVRNHFIRLPSISWPFQLGNPLLEGKMLMFPYTYYKTKSEKCTVPLYWNFECWKVWAAPKLFWKLYFLYHRLIKFSNLATPSCVSWPH